MASDLEARLRRREELFLGGTALVNPDGPEAADALAAQAAEIERLKAAIFGGPGYDPTLRIGNFVEMAHATEAARQGANARADALAARVAEMEGAVATARSHLILLGGDNRGIDGADEIQGAVLDVIDAALHPKTPAPAREEG